MFKKTFFLIVFIFSLYGSLYAFFLQNYDYVEMDKTKITFDDGDTITYESTPIRFLGVDTPEVSHEGHGFRESQHLGEEASAFTKKAILTAKRVYYIPYYKPDYYGRMLAHIVVDDQLLGVKLIEAGLAYETVTRYGDNGFSDISDEIYAAAEKMCKPQFENPSVWRKKNRTGVR